MGRTLGRQFESDLLPPNNERRKKMKFESKFDVGTIVKIIDNSLDEPVKIVGIHFGLDGATTYQCRVPSCNLIYFAEEELEHLEKKDG